MPRPAGTPNPYTAYAWTKLAKQRITIARTNDEPCCRCGRPIDYQLSGNDRHGPTCDHLQPLGLGGGIIATLDQLAPAHRACNSRHGGRLGRALQLATTTRPSRPTPPTPTKNRKNDQNPVFKPGPENSPTGLNLRSAGPDGDLDQLPRVVSPPHPRAVGSLGPAWVAWAEGNLSHPKTGKGLRLRPWQKYVFERALEHDSDGRLVWSDVAVSAARQVGKSWIMYALACARVAHASTFGEQQLVLHVANKLVAARRIHALGWRWAASQGLRVSRNLDSSAITWPDGSSWVTSSLAAAWGETATVAMVDEAWYIEPEVVEEAIAPTLLDPEQSQLWLFSTANREATPTYPRVRRRALAGDQRTLLLEWSAPPDADFSDPEVWRAASPVWSAERAGFLSVKAGQSGFAEQYLNVWPVLGEMQAEWPPGWSAAGMVAASPPRLPVVAVETAPDRSRFGLAAASAVDGAVSVWSRSVGSVEEVRQVLAGWSPGVVLAGVTLAAELGGGMWRVEPVGTRETGWATPILADAVARGRLAHDHDPGMLREVENAKVGHTEAGPVLSARRSDGPIPTVKAVCWAAWAALDGRFAPVKAAIW